MNSKTRQYLGITHMEDQITSTIFELEKENSQLLVDLGEMGLVLESTEFKLGEAKREIEYLSQRLHELEG